MNDIPLIVYIGCTASGKSSAALQEAERLGGYGGMIVNGNCGSDGGYKLADTAVEKINGLFD